MRDEPFIVGGMRDGGKIVAGSGSFLFFCRIFCGMRRTNNFQGLTRVGGMRDKHFFAGWIQDGGKMVVGSGISSSPTLTSLSSSCSNIPRF